MGQFYKGIYTASPSVIPSVSVVPSSPTETPTDAPTIEDAASTIAKCIAECNANDYCCTSFDGGCTSPPCSAGCLIAYYASSVQQCNELCDSYVGQCDPSYLGIQDGDLCVDQKVLYEVTGILLYTLL